MVKISGQKSNENIKNLFERSKAKNITMPLYKGTIYQCPKALQIVISLSQNGFSVSKQVLGDEAWKSLDLASHFLAESSSVRPSGCATQADGAENS